VRLAHDIGSEELAEQGQLGVARDLRPPGDLVDGAVVLEQPDHAVGVDGRLGEVAGVVLENREHPNPVEERCVVRELLGHPSPGAIADLAPPGGEDLLDEIVAPDGLDRLQEPRGEPAVVGREELLGVGGDVVQMARPADTVALGRVSDEARVLERVKLLEDAGARGPEGARKGIRRGRAGLAQVDED
jgi:hypothetical protein